MQRGARRAGWCGTLALVALAAQPAAGQERVAAAGARDVTAEIDRIFSFATAETPGCAVGVSERGRTVVNRTYGLADVEHRTPLGPNTVFDIGSTQKQFVAAAVLLLAEDGRLSLSDDVRSYMPELPDYGRKITIDHLLTHTSGLRDWTGLQPMADGDPDVLELILRQRGLNFAPGEEWAYSNSGYVLLKEIVARVSGMPFSDFARRRLFEPLGMRHSAYVPDILQSEGDHALGYQKDGASWKPFMRLGSRRGGGAIISTAGDLLIWNDALTAGRLGAAVTARLQEPARLANGRTLTYARGLMVNEYPGARLVSHSGGAAGFSTWLGRLTEHGLSVAVLCNFDPVSATDLAHQVINAYLPADSAVGAAPAPAAGAVAVAEADLNRLAGLYFEERTGDPVRLIVVNGRLGIAGAGPLVAVSPDRFRPARASLFFRSQDEFQLHFPSRDGFELTSMEGRTTRYRRAQAWSPSAAESKAFEGRYRSEDLDAVYEIVPRTNGLVLRSARTPERAIEISAADRDTYMRSMMVVRFTRDADGSVTGFTYGNPVAKNLVFTRVGDLPASGAPALSASAVLSATPPTGGAPASTTAQAPRLEGLTGDYEVAPGRILVISLENGRLYGQPGDREKRALTHVSGATFSAAGSAMTLTFTLGADGRATGLVMRQNGQERTVPRVR
ncbi:MAG TPA: serine hydrolase [Longimicrobium sp.]